MTHTKLLLLLIGLNGRIVELHVPIIVVLATDHITLPGIEERCRSGEPTRRRLLLMLMMQLTRSSST